jgi:hypothetical protein
MQAPSKTIGVLYMQEVTIEIYIAAFFFYIEELTATQFLHGS